MTVLGQEGYEELQSGDYPDRFRPDLQHSKIQYDATVTVEEHLAALEAMHAADKSSEKWKSVFMTLGCLGFLAGFGLLFLGELIFDSAEQRFLFGFGVLGVSVVIAIIGYNALGRHDVDDRKLALPADLLETLRPELKPGRPVRITIDFRAYDRASGKRAGAGRIVHDDWLSLELPLLDGTRARIALSTRVKRKERQKRKYTKVKDKVLEEIRVELRAPRDLAGAGANLADRFVGEGMRLARAQVAGRAARFEFVCGPALTVQGRAGFTWDGIARLIDSPKLLGALVFAYKATAAASSDSTASA